MNKEELKSIVQNKYGAIARNNKGSFNKPGCTDDCCGGELDYSIFSDDYSNIEGYNPEADLGLGCGLPTEYADIQMGDSVLDLGSGAGNDCFVARTMVGEKGKVTGLDFTEAMIERAYLNLEKTNFKNIEFVIGDIVDMPLPDNEYDVVISNCVLNLVPDKRKAFQEIFRVLKDSGHFCISDIVLRGTLPDKIRNAVTMYAGCVSGALQKEDYLDVIHSQGFSNIKIVKDKEIKVPNTLLLKYISLEELRAYKRERKGIYSITLIGSKRIY